MFGLSRDPKSEIDTRSDVCDVIEDAIKDCEFTIEHIDAVIPEIKEDGIGVKDIRDECIKELIKEKARQRTLLKKLKKVLPEFKWTMEEYKNNRVF